MCFLLFVKCNIAMLFALHKRGVSQRQSCKCVYFCVNLYWALKNVPYHISKISPFVFPKPGMICCFIVSENFLGEVAPRSPKKYSHLWHLATFAQSVPTWISLTGLYLIDFTYQETCSYNPVSNLTFFD